MPTNEQDTLKLVKRSLPNPHRPRLRTESEQKLAEVDQKSAECYATIEMLTARVHDLAGELEDEGAIPREQSWDDNSLIHHVEDVRQELGAKDPKTGGG